MFDLMNPGTLLSTFKTWYRGTSIYSVLEDNPVLHCHTLLERKEGALITKLTTARCSSWNKAQQRNQNRHKQAECGSFLRWTWTQYEQAVWALSVLPGGVKGGSLGWIQRRHVWKCVSVQFPWWRYWHLYPWVLSVSKLSVCFWHEGVQ